MAIVSLKNSTLANIAKGFAFQKATGAVPILPVPTFTSATTSSYTAAITGYDAQFTYTVSASVGTAVRTGGNVTVSGLSGNQSSTLTVTAANTARELSFSASQAFLSLPATPTLTQTGQTTSSVTVTIGNYDAGLTYTISSSAGSASRSGNAITVTGLTEGQNITVNATASNASGSSTQGSVSATSLQLPTGGTITTSGSYRIHTFTASGTFTTYDTRNVEYLVVAGGGGTSDGGGGGAGGMVPGTANSLPAGTYSIVVGGGGGYSQPQGGSGGPSYIMGPPTTFYGPATGGGGGGSVAGAAAPGVPGGSGGGGGHSRPVSIVQPGGSGISGQGNPGAPGGPGGPSGANQYGGGGGGAGQAGQPGTPGVPTPLGPTGGVGGAGGNGAASSISGSPVFYAGGKPAPGAPPAVPSGSTGANSGGGTNSGIVIVRYLV